MDPHELVLGARLAPADVPALKRRLRVARGQEPGDLLLTGGQVVNVFTGTVEPGNIVIADGWIAGVGNFAWQACQTIDLGGRAVTPGFIDSHMHLESTLLTPAELARMIVPHGTTTIISDSHEIGNVLGIAGIDALRSASAGLPMDLFLTASSCVPATSWEHAGAFLGPSEVRALLGRTGVLALAEMMDIPAVLAGEPGVLEKLQAALVGWEASWMATLQASSVKTCRPMHARESVRTTSRRRLKKPAPRRPWACWSRSAKGRRRVISTPFSPVSPGASSAISGPW